MSRILSLNLDFVLILQGGLLLYLATACWSAAQGTWSRAWFWLGWYAFGVALRAGLDLSVLENNGLPLHDIALTGLSIGSSLCLIEFARTSSSLGPGRWVHLPITGGLLVAFLWDNATVSTGAQIAVALLGGFWATIELWRKSAVAGDTFATRPLRQAALIIGVCQLLSTLPGPYLNNLALDLAGGMPAGVLRGIVFLILTLSILQHQVAQESTLHSAEQSAARQRRRVACISVIVLLVTAGWLCADFAGRQQDKSMRQQILARTEIAAAAVLADDVKQLRWDESDLLNPAYLKLKALMIAMRRANADLRFVLLAGVREQRAYFLVDSEPADSADYSPPGQSYDEATADYLAGLQAGRPFVLGPEPDRWGTWVFGDVPILDSLGQAVAYLELDIAAADWDARIAHARLPALLITLLIVALILGSFQAFERLRDSSALIALSEERNRSLVEGSPDCVQMFDLAGRYVAVNQNGLRALGRSAPEVLGRNFGDLWPAETRPRINDTVTKTLAGQPTTIEADYVVPDGRTVTWRIATNPIHDTAGNVSGFVGICVDLTVRKQAEVALLAAKKAAEAATQAKSDFLAVMSHEIRTPLSGVIGMLELLQQIPLEPQPRRYTKFAKDSADALLHLLDDALDSAKMEAGKLNLESIPFRPHEQFEALFESASMRAATKSLGFRHDVFPGVPAILLGDPTRLRQIINNLVNNALKFTEKGGVTVSLNAEPIGIGSVLLKIAVTDTGIGITEEARSRLFAKYAQADSSTTRHFGGTGLGLSIVKSLAELMGGDVSVTSTPGQGSTFLFSAGFRIGTEAARPAPAKVAVAPAVPTPARQLRVLIVDDDASNRTIAESLVANLGHRDFVSVANGREAIDRLITEKFDVVLMDNRMPVMDGFTATNLIRTPATGVTDPKIYIIALTANASADDRAKCLAGGMDDFVTKPVRAPAISAAFSRVIAHLRNRDQAAPLPAPAGPPPSAPITFSLPPGLSEAELLAALDEDVAAAENSSEDAAALSPEMLEKIIPIFFQETPRRLAAMRLALAQGDAATLGLEAHTLKSNARYLNAQALSRACAQIETLADQREFAGIPALLQETEQAYAELHRRLLQPLATALPSLP